MRDFDVVDHAAADERDFAADARGDVDHLLNAVNGRGKARQYHAPRRGAAKFFDARNDSALGGREARALDVGRVAEQRQHAFVAVARESVQIERRAVDGRLINLEIAGVNDDAERRAHRQRDAIDGAVRHGNEFDFERADLDQAAGHHFAQRRGVEQAGFFQALFHQRQREARSVNGNVQIAQDVWQRADVIFVAVG